MTKMSVGDPILTAPTDDKRYVDWANDDTERDPTPANKRRSELYAKTYPKAGTTMKGERG